MTPAPLPALTLTPGEELGRLVRCWRERLDPDDLPGHLAPTARSRRRKRVSQEQAAALIGYSVGWISSLERGDRQNYSIDFLDRVAETLRLSSDEKTLLFLLAAGHEPPMAGRHPVMTATADVRRLLDAQPWPAYIVDDAWDLVAVNDHMREWFPWVAGPETNVMRWIFTAPEARRQLHRWETDWGPQMLAQLRFAHARTPGNERLTEVLAEILHGNADARRFWDHPTAHVRPDNARRSLCLPCHRRRIQPVQLVTLEPQRAPGNHLTILLPAEPDPA
ncbi:helix-turn-helix domain-containing protein [Actinoplanes utahensis]|uniref:helix-turn-helix domain-containing protein n=1 Tax=Actinoplanes utahensis TaxID=1869 RepID=UPI00068ED932|nr:helix-turn-helix domain-containing protein [Actinoplanes utahensis]GIF33433.1 hypothetical protein Aut01nite_64190 [Actinoplanes utahensis]